MKGAREGDWGPGEGTREEDPGRGPERCTGPGEGAEKEDQAGGWALGGGWGPSQSRARPVGLIDRGEQKRGRPEDGQEWTSADYKNRMVPARSSRHCSSN